MFVTLETGRDISKIDISLLLWDRCHTKYATQSRLQADGFRPIFGGEYFQCSKVASCECTLIVVSNCTAFYQGVSLIFEATNITNSLIGVLTPK